MLALVSVEGYHGYLLFVWIYGLFFGGMEVALRVYCYERLKIKQYARGWGFVQGVKAIPYLIGLPISAYISKSADGNITGKTGFYFSFTFCILGGCVIFLMECFKGGYGHSDASYYGGSRMDLCKNDSNMTFEMNGGPSGGQYRGEYRGESASMMMAEPPDARDTRFMMPGSNGHLKCTCLPSSASLMEDKMKDVEEVSAALAEVSTASHHSKVQFNDEIEVVKEQQILEPNEIHSRSKLEDVEDEDEDEEHEDMIDLAQALFAAGVRPEHLASISEENLFLNGSGTAYNNAGGLEEPQLILSDEDTASGLQEIEENDEEEDDLVDDLVNDDEANGQPYLMWSEVEPEAMIEFSPKLLKSQSEPDLLHLLNEEEKRPHPSSRSILEAANTSAACPVKRQKSWHPIQSIKRSNGIGTSPTSMASPAPEELTSFV